MTSMHMKIGSTLSLSGTLRSKLGDHTFHKVLVNVKGNREKTLCSCIAILEGDLLVLEIKILPLHFFFSTFSMASNVEIWISYNLGLWLTLNMVPCMSSFICSCLLNKHL